jgi:uncharacterized membrane protein
VRPNVPSVEACLKRKWVRVYRFAHLYRGEIYRMRFWRERLDRTTPWEIIVIAGILTWAFSSRSRPHYIILMAIAILWDRSSSHTANRIERFFKNYNRFDKIRIPICCPRAESM